MRHYDPVKSEMLQTESDDDKSIIDPIETGGGDKSQEVRFPGLQCHASMILGFGRVPDAGTIQVVFRWR